MLDNAKNRLSEMQTSELNIQKTSAKGEARTATSNTKTVRPALNDKAAGVFLQKIAVERPAVSEGLQRTLNSLHASLSATLNGSAEDLKNADVSQAQGPLARLSKKLIDRDPALQEKTARALSSSEAPVPSRDASAVLGKSLAQLPSCLHEGSETGDALARAVTGSLSDLSDHGSMGAGLIRDLAVRGIYITEEPLSLKNRSAAERVLNSTAAFIQSNSPQTLSSLKKEVPQGAASVEKAPSLKADHNHISGDPDAYLQNTYNDIFKRKASSPENIKAENFPQDNRPDLKTASNAELPKTEADPSRRIKQIIEKAADTVRRGNLSRTSAGQNDDSSASPNTKTQSATPLRELASRASTLERQFREERQRMLQEGNIPADDETASTQKAQVTNSSEADANTNVPIKDQKTYEKNTSSDGISFKDLNKAQVKFSYSALQNSFYGGISSVPGMDLPVEDFNSAAVQDFVAASQAHELSSKRVLNTVLQEQRELLNKSDGAVKNDQTSTDPVAGKKEQNDGSDDSLKNTPASKDTPDKALKNDVNERPASSSDTAVKKEALSSSEDEIVADDGQNTDETAPAVKEGDLKKEATALDADPDKTATDVEREIDASKQPNADEAETTKKSDLKEEATTAPAIQPTYDNHVIIKDTSAKDIELDHSTVNASSSASDAVDQTPSSVHGSVTEDPMPKDILRDELIGKDYRNIKPSDFSQNVLSKQAVESVKADENAQKTTLSNADGSKNGILSPDVDGKPGRDGILNFLTPAGKEADAGNKDAIVSPNLDYSAPKIKAADPLNSAQVLPSAASSVTTGGDQPLPEESIPDLTVATKEDGLFKRIASLFSRSDNADNKANIINSQMAAEVSVKVPMLKNSPLDVFMQTLTAASSNLTLPAIVRKQALQLKDKLSAPLSDLTAVDNWLSFVTGPMSPSSSRAAALQQWAFLILCLRFKQLGKNVSSFIKKNDLKGFDEALEDLLLPSPDSKEKIADLSSETLQQIASLQQQKRTPDGFSLLDRFIPLPPSYEGGREGGMMIRKDQDKEGKNVWHLSFQFDLEKLGALEVKAVAALPEVRISFAAETLEGLKAVQSNCMSLKENLEQMGLEVKNSAPRLGRIQPLSGERERKPLDPSPATGISLEI